jgi:hypothetical protein
MILLLLKDVFLHKRIDALGGYRGTAMAMPEKNIGLPGGDRAGSRLGIRDHTMVNCREIGQINRGGETTWRGQIVDLFYDEYFFHNRDGRFMKNLPN